MSAASKGRRIEYCDKCQCRYPAHAEHVCEPMKYRDLLPGKHVGLGQGTVLHAMQKIQHDGPLFYLYVHPDDVYAGIRVAQGLLWQSRSIHINVLPRQNLRRYEWCVAAGGEFVGSWGKEQ